MKILYITQYFPPEIGAGPVRAQANTDFLSEQGHDVDVLCQFPNYPTGKTPGNYKGKWLIAEQHGYLRVNRVWVFPTARKNRLDQLLLFGSFFITGLFFAIRNIKEYDIIYASSPPLSSALIGAFLSRLTGIKWIFEVRDLWPDSLLGTAGGSSASLLYKLLKHTENRLYKSADLTIAVTDAAAETIQSNQPLADVRVVHNGVDPESFIPAEPDAENSTDTFRVGYIGSIGVIHDFEPVVRAAKLCEDDSRIQFIIVGDGSRADELEELVRYYKPLNLQWIGLKPYSEIPDIMKTFHIGLNPIRNAKPFETIINVKFYEYLSCQVPVISLGRGTIKMIGDESRSAITLDPGDYKGLAENIKELLANPDKLRKLKENSRSFVYEAYNRKNLAADIEALIQYTANK
ncbi:MAG: glycosyltransferase family 4 protein [Balneolia bacterium]|nr:glycosyltransferase family 4 protein [Balneolia bacterium]